jgi:hypothetical protein
MPIVVGAASPNAWTPGRLDAWTPGRLDGSGYQDDVHRPPRQTRILGHLAHRPVRRRHRGTDYAPRPIGEPRPGRDLSLTSVSDLRERSFSVPMKRQREQQYRTVNHGSWPFSVDRVGTNSMSIPRASNHGAGTLNFESL